MQGMFSKKLLSSLITSGLLISTQVQADYQWTYQYNDKGQVTQTDGPRTDVSDVTQYQYDAQGNLTQITNALGHMTQLSNFDIYGSPQTVINPNGLEISLSYDSLGRLIQQTKHSQQGDVTTLYTYNAVGLLTQVTLPDNHTISYHYDSARRLTSMSNSLGESITYTLDAMGNRTSEQIKDQSGQLTRQSTQAFDEMGRLLEWVGAAGQRQRFSYDVDSNLTGQIDGNNNPSAQGFDALHRLVSVTDAHNQMTQLSYDTQDNLTSVTDPRGITTSYTYDAFGRVISRSSPDTGTTTYEYDSAGNAVKSTNARGVVTTYLYDALNRVIARDYPSAPELNVSYIYDDFVTDGAHLNAGIGYLTQMTDHLGTVTYRYDDRGNPIEKARQINAASLTTVEVTGYHWDLSDRLTAIDYPSGLKLNYQRNSAGQVHLVSLESPQGIDTLAEQIGYQPFGGIKQLVWGNGVALNRDYDLDGRLINQQVGNLQSLSYSYDGVNNITQRLRDEVEPTDSSVSYAVTESYSYDALNRLTHEQQGVTEYAYEYDEVGNRTLRTKQKTKDDGSVKTKQEALTYGTDNNRLVTRADRSITSDETGNILAGLKKHQSYTYDATGRLSELRKKGNLKNRYLYNGVGERVVKVVQKKNGQSHRVYQYDLSGQLIQDTVFNKKGHKKAVHHYVWLDNLPLAHIWQKFDKNGAIKEQTLSYIHSDHLNTPRLASNDLQSVIWRWQSTAFGLGKAEKDPDGDGKNVNIALRFPGQYYDVESGLHYNYYRDYDPRTGRYIQSDPIGLQGGLNTYAYVSSNPMNNIDPKGLYCIPCIGAGLALLLNSTPANAPNDCDPVEEYTGFDAFFDSASIIIPPAKVAKGPVKEIIEEIVQSAARPARPGSLDSRALQALKKKVDRNDSAYQGLPKTQEGANDLIREVLNSKNPVVRTKDRNGQEVRDVFDTSTGRGVRTIDGKFDTFVNL